MNVFRLMSNKAREIVDSLKSISRRREFKKMPNTSIHINNIFDRLGSKISQSHITHSLKKILVSGKITKEHINEFAKTMKVINRMKGKWVKKFLGWEKDVDLFVTPWETGTKKITKYHLTEEYAAAYLSRLWKVYKLLEKKTYMPSKYGAVQGFILSKNKQRRFIITHGHRRLAALYCLGVKKIQVQVVNEGANLIEKGIPKWMNVQNGIYTQSEAKKFFNYFFKK